MINPFFKNTGPHNINFLLRTINLKNDNLSEHKIVDIKDLNSAKKNEITFLHSKKYIELAKNTKASYCLTSENFKSFLPKNCKAIITDKVLFNIAQITKIFIQTLLLMIMITLLKIYMRQNLKIKLNLEKMFLSVKT